MGPNPILLVSLEEEDLWTYIPTEKKKVIWIYREKIAIYKPKRETSEETNPANSWMLNF